MRPFFVRFKSVSQNALVVVLILATGCGVAVPDTGGGAAGPPAPVAEVAGLTAGGQSRMWSFDADPEESVPPGTGVYGGRWVVRSVVGAPSAPNVLCQVGNGERPALSLGAAVYGDLAAAVYVNLATGELDRAGGLLFRVQDRDNYYLLSAATREDNVGLVGLYEYVNGQRSLIREMPAPLSAGEWQELRVEAVGDQIAGFLNGQPVIQVVDTGFSSGTLGLWAGSGSVICFDEVTAASI